MNFDIVIIGSGPGGYVCAVRAGQLGLKTAIIEKETTLGGTCLNVGCIPSKALLESSELYVQAQHDFKSHGVELSGVSLDLKKMMDRKASIVKGLTQGVAFLMKKNKVEVFKGFGRLTGPNNVEVKAGDGTTQNLSAKNIILATGSVPTELPFLKFDQNKIVSSTGALSLPEVPKKLVVVGGGVIGLELGSVWARLGAEVTVVEYADKLAATMDQQAIGVLQKALAKEGMKFLLSTKVTGYEYIPGKSNIPDTSKLVRLKYESVKDGTPGVIESDAVLVSTGRKPFSEGLGINELGIQQDKLGRVNVDSHFRTNIPSVYAIGDLIQGPMLAHKAEEEGVAVAEYIGTGTGHINYNTVPSVIYTFPEVASVGLTEEEAKSKGIEISVGSFPFMANGRAKALGQTDGFVKIIADSKSDKIIGGHIVGPRASELLGEIVVAMEFGGSSEDLARSFHAHPTLNEVVREAALGVSKRIRQM